MDPNLVSATCYRSTFHDGNLSIGFHQLEPGPGFFGFRVIVFQYPLDAHFWVANIERFRTLDRFTENGIFCWKIFIINIQLGVVLLWKLTLHHTNVLFLHLAPNHLTF